MKPLDLPVPGTVTARYLIPLRTAMTGAQARQRTIEAIEAQLTGVRQARILDWVRRGAVTIDVNAVPDGTRPLPEPVGTVRAIVRACATGPSSLVAPHEWKARGVAAALAASLDTPLFDAQSVLALEAGDVLAALPSVDLVDPRGDDLSAGCSIESWVRFNAFAHGGCQCPSAKWTP